jgi:type I restriction enzyme S subunit
MSGWRSNWPDRWELVTIGDVVIPKVKQGTPHTDFTYIDIGSINNKTKQIESTKEFSVGSKIPSRAQQHVQSGDILVSTTRPNLNAVAKVPPELDGAICSTGFDVLRPIEVEPAWLFLIVKSRPFVDAMASLVQGALYPAVRPADIRAYRFALPPLAEQRRIAAKIEILQERSQRAREALAEVGLLLEQFRQAVLAAAFRGDLTAGWRASHPNGEPASELLQRIRAERRRYWEQAELDKYEARGQKPPKNWLDKYEEPKPVDNSNLSALPEGWCWAGLEELKDLSPNSMIDGPFGSKLKTSHYSDSGIRVVRLGNIGIGHFNVSDEAFIPQSRYEELKKHEIFAGDLVIAALAEPVGRCCKIPPSIGKAIVKADCIRFRPHPSVLPEIVMHWLNSGTGRRLAEMASHGIGRLRINMENLRALPVALPPVDEQIEIVISITEQLAGIARIEAQVRSCNEDLDQLDQTILTKALRGELMPQDPSDEPVSALLERIRRQREQQGATVEGTRKAAQIQRRDAMRKKSSGMTSQHQPLLEVLTTKGKPMPPEQLLTETGYDDDTIEDFYLVLREEIANGRIRETRLTESNVILEAVKQ